MELVYWSQSEENFRLNVYLVIGISGRLFISMPWTEFNCQAFDDGGKCDYYYSASLLVWIEIDGKL